MREKHHNLAITDQTPKGPPKPGGPFGVIFNKFHPCPDRTAQGLRNKLPEIPGKTGQAAGVEMINKPGKV